MNESNTNQAENRLFPELFSITSSCSKNIEVSFAAPDLSSVCGSIRPSAQRKAGDFQRYCFAQCQYLIWLFHQNKLPDK